MTDIITADVNDDTPPSWVPSELGQVLPADTHPLWLRLEELTALSWPTAAEQVERRMLVVWLKPTSDRIIMDTEVFGAMCDLFHYSPRGNMSMLRPVYDEAAKVWANLTALAAGEVLEPARPEFEDKLGDEWHDARCEQSLDWWETTMRVLNMLSLRNDINERDLMDKVTNHEVRRAMYRHFVDGLFDSPMAVGASIYREPGALPGTGFGGSRTDQGAYIMASMTHAVIASTAALKKADSTNRKAYEAALMAHDYAWQILKGYIWGGTYQQGDGQLPQQLVDHPDVWENAKSALARGLEVLNIHRRQLKGVGFASKGGARSEEIMSEPTADLLARMDGYVRRAEQNRRTAAEL